MGHSLKLGVAAGVLALVCCPSALAQGAGSFDGTYSGLDQQVVDQTTVVDAVAEEQAVAQAAAEEAEQTLSSVVDTITVEEQAAIEASIEAYSSLLDAISVADAALDVEADAQAQRNQAQQGFASAQNSLALASGDEAAASEAVSIAASSVADAEEARNAVLADINATPDQIVAATEAFQAAQQDLAEAQTALSIAESATADETAAVAAAATSVLDANSSLSAAAAQTAIAQEAVNVAGEVDAELFAQAQAALAGNVELSAALALADPNYVPGQEAESLNTLAFATGVAAANRDFVSDVAAFQTAALDGLNRQGDILTAAVASGQSNIILASGALTGDPAAVHSNYETEVLGALVDHEGRISTNTANIAAETEARVEADNNLLIRITDETQARIAADTALSSRVDVLYDRVGVNETRIRELSDKVQSSAAVAIALGGTGFLPGKKFNFSTNLGVYEGAQAISATLGARLSDNVALTGGVAGGLNKEGGIGARVGLIFGW
jgi:hypothetical protein